MRIQRTMNRLVASYRPAFAGLVGALVVVLLPQVAWSQDADDFPPFDHCTAPGVIEVADVNCNGIPRALEYDLQPVGGSIVDCLDVLTHTNCLRPSENAVLRQCDDYFDDDLGDGLGATCRSTQNELLDADFDCFGDNRVLNICDNCPEISNFDQADRDMDGVGDVCDNCPDTPNPGQSNTDSDGDGFPDDCDVCPALNSPDQTDSDGDGFGDECDNCPMTPNSDQTNSDSDDFGDACDVCKDVDDPDQNDTDRDGLGDLCDNCVNETNPMQENDDGDTLGNACDNCKDVDNQDQADADSDEFGDACDNCVSVANPDQANQDDDVFGDACDNCPTTTNPEQEASQRLTDAEGKPVGVVCEPGVRGNGGCSSSGNGSPPWLPLLLLALAGAAIAFGRRRILARRERDSTV